MVAEFLTGSWRVNFDFRVSVDRVIGNDMLAVDHPAGVADDDGIRID